jgi:GT2 family glycosyltransferase
MVAKQPYFTVIIVAYNSGAYLHECINALNQQTFKDFEVIIFDNGTEDGSVDSISSSSFSINIIKSTLNKGFAFGNNAAVKDANGDWLILLNADAIPQSDWLREIFQAICRYPEIVIFGSTQINYHNPEVLDGAGDHYHPFGLAWRGAKGYPADSIAADAIVMGPCAAAAIYKKDIFEKLGGMEEHFFCYYEDVDLALRFRLEGHLCIQLANAKVKHVGSATFGTNSEFSRYYISRNKIWTFFRCLPAALLISLLPSFFIIVLIRLCFSIGRSDFKIRLRALWDALYNLPEIWGERRSIQSSRKIGVVQFGRSMTWSIGKLLMRSSDGRSIPKSVRVNSIGKADACNS